MKMTKLRWWIIGLVCVGTIVNYLSRSSLSVAAPAMMKELHFDEQQYSWVVSAFQLCYTIAQPITGYLMDVIGLKIGFFIFALLWSLINMAHALAGGWISLAFLRGLMGLTEASAIPAGIKASAEWFPTKERGIAGGLFNIGTSIGAMLAPPLVVWAMLTFADSGIGTEMAFVITGGIGVLFAITWFLIYNSPNKHPWITHKELRYIEDGQESYLQDDNKKPAVKEIAMFAWLPFLAADFGCVAGGFLAKFFMEKMHMTTINARRCSFTIGAVLMISIGFVSITTNPYVAIALMSIGGFAHQTLSTVVITMSADLFKKNEVATVAGLAGSAAWMGQLSFNLFMGALVAIIGYGPFFIALSLFDIIGAIILWVLIKDPEKHHPPMTEQPLASHR
ncbi:TPA_asm: MFS transporter [Salmonella enterica subsp. enterica serovar Typhimurium]|uniref:MFS transporter n=1 Tax=Salmonella enterica TaxID=28901 RepID=UPI0018204743|nr:MFS transporter [Salmonella enterica]MBL6130470.1 MFS transporter [Salmonella enterica subsp. enterica serovar Typhimurium]HAC6582171.1 MFS transporter [Salmonella enterica subsp. enterica serovar Typhimurium]HAC9985724.1 MFS transporter [Salmonella enterica subsp. enterica serovar Typhimurium]HAF8956800.1 MFS transporter [Salmonella enterica]